MVVYLRAASSLRFFSSRHEVYGMSFVLSLQCSNTLRNVLIWVRFLASLYSIINLVKLEKKKKKALVHILFWDSSPSILGGSAQLQSVMHKIRPSKLYLILFNLLIEMLKANQQPIPLWLLSLLPVRPPPCIHSTG